MSLKAEKELDQDFQGNLLLALGDHIHFAIDRTKNNEPLKNPLAWEIKRIYKNEYQIGQQALNIIENKLHIRLDDVEAASIAIHLINAQKEGSRVENTISQVKIIEDIVRIVELHYGENFDEETISFSRFITHLQYFAERVNNKQLYKGDDDTFLYEQVRESYPKAFSCSEKIKRYVESEYDYSVGREEQVYLTIHIQRLTK